MGSLTDKGEKSRMNDCKDQIMPQSAEHVLIFNCVKGVLINAAPGLSEAIKNGIAIQIAIQLRSLVRVKERDE